jgi:hypothetical protein
MTRFSVLAALAAIGISLVLPPSVGNAEAAQIAQAAPLAGEWADSQPCAASGSRLRFAGNTLTFFAANAPMSAYEVEIADAADRVTVSIVRVIAEPRGPGGLAPGARLDYRHVGEDLRLVGMAMPGGQFMSPTVATLYQRCK